VVLRPERASALIGLEIDAREQFSILHRLGFEGEPEVTVPTWRARDVTREVDLIEEVARFRLADVPFTLPERRVMFGRMTHEQRLRRTVEDVMVGLGFSEAYTPSLVAVDPDDDALRLPIPLTTEAAELRTTLVPSLAQAVARNVETGRSDAALFEIARVYFPTGAELPREQWTLAAVTTGGFPRAKSALDVLFASLKIEQRIEPGRHALSHPGKTGVLPQGWIGELLTGGAGAFELSLDELAADVPGHVAHTDVVTYPAVRQDLAFVVPAAVTAAELAAAMRAAAGPELREVRPFDEYRSAELGAGRKSVAFSVAFQSPERTLTDDDAAALRGRIVDALASRFGAELRA
jgi:phenylalanyl-tRNA synthetase beta chain